jgi:hypothetical protein
LRRKFDTIGRKIQTYLRAQQVPSNFTRRFVVGSLATLPLLPASRAFAAAPLPKVVVHKDPNCGCCGAWVEHLRQAGFTVEVVETNAINRVKARLGVPDDLASCHTAEMDGYIIEGHVPAASIKRLLSERPAGKGLAVPGMPIGSPGMEVPGTPPDEYTVMLFGPSGQRPYARYLGRQEL